MFKILAALVFCLFATSALAGAPVACGREHSSSLESKRGILTWGNNRVGQLGNGHFGVVPPHIPPIANPFAGVALLAAGSYHTLAVDVHGNLLGFGSNFWGQLGDSTRENRPIPIKIPIATPVIDITCGDVFSLALTNEGTLYFFGNNNYGQRGDGSRESTLSPKPVPGLPKIATAAAGHFHVAAVDTNGNVWTWGRNNHGQLGDGSTSGRLVPAKVEGLDQAVAVAAGKFHTVVLRCDGSVWAFGGGLHGRLGNGSELDQKSPVQSLNEEGGFLANIKAIACGADHTLALDASGAVWGYGYNYYGQLTSRDEKWVNALRPLKVFFPGNVVAMAGGDAHTVALQDDGRIFAVGFNNAGQVREGLPRRVGAPVQINR